MIKSKCDLKFFLKCDKKALFIEKKNRPNLLSDEIWRFEILLRKTEYAINCKKGIAFFLYRMWHKLLFHRMSVKLGFSIPLNVFGAGLSIAHYGTIVVNSKAKIGEFCRIQESVNIGSTNGEDLAPRIGNNVFIGSGAKIIGDIDIADDIVIGAGAVVVKSFLEKGITLAGVPAKKISNNNSSCYINSGRINTYEDNSHRIRTWESNA